MKTNYSKVLSYTLQEKEVLGHQCRVLIGKQLGLLAEKLVMKLDLLGVCGYYAEARH